MAEIIGYCPNCGHGIESNYVTNHGHFRSGVKAHLMGCWGKDGKSPAPDEMRLRFGLPAKES